MDPIFEPIPSHFAIQSVGYGFGKRDTGKFNALRGSLLKEDTSHSTTVVHHTEDHIVEITTTIDDQTPEQLGLYSPPVSWTLELWMSTIVASL